MALTPEDLQAIEQIFDKKMDEKLEKALAPIHEKLDALEEHAEITRSATNTLVEWADNVSVVTQIKFPVAK